MTEKRFVSEDDCCGYYTEIIDNEKELDLSLHNPKKNLTIEELVDLLNKLVDENKQLQKDCTALIYNNQEYRKENEKLKQQLKFFNELNEPYKILIEENQRLKLFIKQLKSCDGKIYLMNGMVCNTKVLNFE